jgi:hypothetical protein
MRLPVNEAALLGKPLLVAAIWVLLYTSDYYLTLYGAKLRSLQKVFVYQGSYELTPECQDDIDSGNRRSPAFFLWLGVGVLMLLMPLRIPEVPKWVYGFFVGYILFVELPVHLRHISNIWTYRSVLGSKPALSGEVRLSQRGSYQRSAADLAAMAGFLVVCCGLTGSCVLLGGSLRSAHEAYRHWRLSKECPEPAWDAGNASDEADAANSDAEPSVEARS